MDVCIAHYVKIGCFCCGKESIQLSTPDISGTWLPIAVGMDYQVLLTQESKVHICGTARGEKLLITTRLFSETIFSLWNRCHICIPAHCENFDKDNFRSDVQIRFRIQLLITMIRRLLRLCRIVQGGRLSLCLISKHFWIIQAGGCEKIKLWKVNTSQRLQDV